MREGRGVAFLADQGVLGLASTFVPFFGRPAKTPRGPAVFALRLDVPVVFGVALRQPSGKYRLVFEPVKVENTGDRDRDVDAIVAGYTATLERWVRRYPEQYFWHHQAMAAAAARYAARAAGAVTDSPSLNRSVWRSLRRDARSLIGLGVIAIIVGAAVFAPLIATEDPLRIDLVGRLDAPSAEHWMGTDVQGRDIWSRLVYGARVSLAVGLVSQAIALSLGVVFGLLAGYYGKWVDELVMRLADVTLAFPTLLLLIAMVAALNPSLGVVLLTIGIVGWAGMARLVRGQVLVVRQLEYVQAIRALGARDTRIIARHVLPNVIAPVVIAATLGVAGAIMAEAALSFLGLGVQPPTPSWGAMIADGRDLNLLRNAPWTSVFPGLAIGAAVLGFNLLGDALRDALDPRRIEAAVPAAGVPTAESTP